MNIIVTGSLGHISKPLTETLIREGHSVTVITSSPLRRPDIEALGAQAATGSVTDTAFLQEVFTGADAVYCMIPPDFGQQDQIGYYERVGHSYAEAIRASGIHRVVHLSSYGAHLASGTGFITGSYRVEQLLNAIPGIQLTHMRPSFFYYNLAHMAGMIRAAGFIGNVYGGDDQLSLVAPEDIAAAVADELVKTVRNNTVRYVASDDRTCSEIASILGRAIGKPDLQWKVLPPDQVLQGLQANGIPPNAAHNLVELGEAIHSGKLREDYDLHKPSLGKVSLEQYAVEFARLYKNG